VFQRTRIILTKGYSNYNPKWEYSRWHIVMNT
jgi:hypothetical protein